MRFFVVTLPIVSGVKRCLKLCPAILSSVSRFVPAARLEGPRQAAKGTPSLPSPLLDKARSLGSFYPTMRLSKADSR
jgi:hypothetical protein